MQLNGVLHVASNPRLRYGHDDGNGGPTDIDFYVGHLSGTKLCWADYAWPLVRTCSRLVGLGLSMCRFTFSLSLMIVDTSFN